MKVPSYRWLVVVIASLAGSMGCAAPSRGASVQDGIQTIRRESTADKLVARGRAFASVGDLTRSEQYLAAALESGADPKTTLPALLRVCIEARRYHVALDYAEPWLRRDPDDVDLRFVVATLHRAIGDDAAAEGNLDVAVDHRPGDPALHFALATLLLDSGRERKKADDHFRAYLRLAPRGEHAAEARASLLRDVE